MNDVVKNEIIKELNWKERIVVKICPKTFNRVCNIVRLQTVNQILK